MGGVGVSMGPGFALDDRRTVVVWLSVRAQRGSNRPTTDLLRTNDKYICSLWSDYLYQRGYWL